MTSYPYSSGDPLPASDMNEIFLQSRQFGGDGSDGSLDTTGGTVDIDCGAAAFVVKNYSEITIATNNLTFSNPNTNGTLVLLRCSGDVTISATVDVTGIGGQGGSANNDGNTASHVLDDSDHHGTNPGGASGVGTGGSQYSNLFLYTDGEFKKFRGIWITPGSGGAGGTSDNGSFGAMGGGGAGGIGGAGGDGSQGGPASNAGGASAGGGGAGGSSTGTGTGTNGGAGGGAIIIECAGDLNFTGTIDVSGEDGEDATTAQDGAGGGGAGGMAVVIYNSATATSGTIDSSGGAGGDNTSDSFSGGTGGASNGGVVIQHDSYLA